MSLEDSQDFSSFGGKYEVLAELGEGGMGRVFKVRHRDLQVLRVIKVMRSNLSSDASLRDRFLQEARKLCRLDHPNVARLWDFEVNAQGVMFMVIEYIEGQNLADYLEKKGPPALPLALDIAIQSLEAIDCLHQEGWVHRDISPDNLMLTQEEDGACRVKLIDLGIAKELEGGKGHTTPGHFVGKVRYASPEQLSLRPLTTRSDVYSFGICLYELLTGHFPIPGNDMTSLIAAHTTGKKVGFDESDPNHRVPRKLRDLVMKAMEADPDDRFRSATEFRQALEGVRRQLGVAGKRTMIEIVPSTDERDSSRGEAQRWFDENFRGDDTTEGRKLSNTLAQVQSLLDSGNLDDAEKALGQARARHADHAVFRDLAGRLDRLKVERRNEEAQQCLSAAQRLQQDGDYRAAIRLLERARELAPETPGLESLLEELLLLEEARRRREALAQTRRSLEETIASAPIDKARMALYAARRRFGDDDLRDLIARLDEREAAERAAAVQETVTRIISEMESGSLETAVSAIDAAESQLGSDEAFAELRQRAERLAKEREAVQRRIADQLKRAAALVDSRDPAEALPLLDEARSLGAADAAVTPIENRARDAIRVRRKLDDLLAAARGYLRTRDLETARNRVEEALELDGEDPDALALRREIDAAVEEEGARRQRAAELVELARRRLDGNLLDEALGLVDEAHDIDPQNDELQQLQREIRRRMTEQHRKKRDADRLASEAQSLLENDDVDGALEKVEAALELEPDNAVATLVYRNALKEQEQTRTASAEAKQIVELLQHSRLDEAERALTNALKRYGKRGGLPQLRSALEEAKRQQVEARLSASIEEARARGLREDFRGALELIEEVLQVHPGYREAEVLRERWVKALERRGELERASEARRREVTAILDEARQLVNAAKVTGERDATDVESWLASSGRVQERLESIAATEAEYADARQLLNQVEAATADAQRALKTARQKAVQDELKATEILVRNKKHLAAVRRLEELERTVTSGSDYAELGPRIRRMVEDSRRALRRQYTRWGGIAAVVVLVAVAGYAVWYLATGTDPATERLNEIRALPETTRNEMSEKIGEFSELQSELPPTHRLVGRLQSEKRRVADLRDVQDRLNNIRQIVDGILSGQRPSEGEAAIVRSNIEDIVESLDEFGDDATAERIRTDARAELDRLDAAAP